MILHLWDGAAVREDRKPIRHLIAAMVEPAGNRR